MTTGNDTKIKSKKCRFIIKNDDIVKLMEAYQEQYEEGVLDYLTNFTNLGEINNYLFNKGYISKESRDFFIEQRLPLEEIFLEDDNAVYPEVPSQAYINGKYNNDQYEERQNKAFYIMAEYMQSHQEIFMALCLVLYSANNMYSVKALENSRCKYELCERFVNHLYKYVELHNIDFGGIEIEEENQKLKDNLKSLAMFS